MPLPNNSDAFLPVTPGNLSLCEAMQRLLATNEKLAANFAYLFGSDGLPSDDNYRDLILPAKLIERPIGDTFEWSPMAGGLRDPEVWVNCDGRTISRTVHARLFAAWSTTYGVGDGSTTFGVPDFRDLLLANGGAAYAAGTTIGTAGVFDLAFALTAGSIPPHKHYFGIQEDGFAGGVTGDGALGNVDYDQAETPATYGRTNSATTEEDQEDVEVDLSSSIPRRCGVLYVLSNFKSPRGTIL